MFEILCHHESKKGLFQFSVYAFWGGGNFNYYWAFLQDEYALVFAVRVKFVDLDIIIYFTIL